MGEAQGGGLSIVCCRLNFSREKLSIVYCRLNIYQSVYHEIFIKVFIRNITCPGKFLVTRLMCNIYDILNKATKLAAIIIIFFLNL